MSKLKELKIELAEYQAELKLAESAAEKATIQKAIKSVEADIIQAEREGEGNPPPPPQKKTAKPRAKKPMSEAAKTAFVEKMPTARAEKVENTEGGVPKKYKVTGKGKKPVSKIGMHPYPSMRERVKNTDRVTADELENMEGVMLRCHFKSKKVTKKTEVHILGDTMIAYEGDHILYRSEDGAAFTVLAASTFEKRCVRVKFEPHNGDKLKLVVHKKDGKHVKVGKTEKVKAHKSHTDRHHIAKIHEKADAVVHKMKAEKIDMNDFFANIQGSKLSDYFFSEAKAFNADETDYRIVRVIATKEGNLYVGKQKEDVSSYLKRKLAWLVDEKIPLTWYRVCPVRGVETEKDIDYTSIKHRTKLPKFGDDAVNSKLLKRIYDYPEASFAYCKNMAGDYYEAIADLKDDNEANDKAALKELREVGKKYRNKCLTSRWREVYTKYNEKISELTKDYRNHFRDMNFSTARKKVINIMAQKYKAGGGALNVKELYESWKDNLPDDRGND
jgi:hypothetical protein